MTSTEHRASKPSRVCTRRGCNRGFLATLVGRLLSNGTRAPKISRRVGVPFVLLLALSAVLAFTATPALAAAPTVISESSTGVKATEARVEAVVNAGNEVTECHFQYGALSVSEHEVPCEAEVLGGEEQTVGVTLSGLTEHTPYVYRVLLKNLAAEEAMGAEEPFETAITPETPVTESPEAVTGNTATLRGELDPHSEALNGYHFAYNTNGECAGGTTSAPGEEEEATERKVSTAVTGLEPLREYTVCVVSTNAAGEETLGNAVPFNTPAAPAIVESESASNIKSTEATLEGSVNPNNQLTECHFSYGISTVAENTVPCTPELLKGFGGQSVAPNPQPLTGLTPGAEYKYRILTKNGKGEESTGEPKTFKTAEEPEKQPASAVTATTATLNGVLNPHHPFEAGTYEFAYRQSATECQLINPKTGQPENEKATPAAASTEATPQPVSAELTALQPGATYTYCLLERNAAGQQAAISAPETFTTLSAAPEITAEFASNIQETGVILNAQVNPDGAATTYQFQYGTTESYGHSEPAEPAKLEGPLTSIDAAAANIAGLAPSTTYHYRVVATNTVEGKTETTEGKDKTFTTPAAPGAEPPQKCPENEQRRAEQPFAQALPDCRAYEMVSPLQSEGHDATEPGLSLGTVRAAVSGEAITYLTAGSFAEPKGALFRSQILSRRGPAGWSTRSIIPPFEAYQGNFGTGYSGVFFNPELSAGLTGTDAPLAAEAPHGLEELYLADLTGSTYTLVSRLPSSEEIYAEPYEQRDGDGVFPMGSSSDLSHIVFIAGSEGSGTIREWAGGRVVTVDVPNTPGEPWQAGVGATIASNPEGQGTRVWRAVSADGSRVVFTRSVHGEPGVEYVRENPEQPQSPMNGSECLDAADACTIQISAGAAKYEGASTDDSRIFYTENGDLYEYSLPLGSASGEARALTHEGNVQGVVQISEDGSYVYFVANAVLGDGAAHGAVSGNCRIEEEQYLGACNLYVSHDGGETKFIATLSNNDHEDWSSGSNTPARDEAAVTPNGARLAFTSEQSLTGYDNQQAEHGDCELKLAESAPERGRCHEVYVYDAESGTLTCASCNPTGARPVGGASIVGQAGGNAEPGDGGNYRPRYFLADGALFFTSSDALVAHASDGRRNVYEYENGHLYPISNVAGGYESFFIDASARRT